MRKVQSFIVFIILLLACAACSQPSSTPNPTPRIIYPVGFSTQTPRPTSAPPADYTPTAVFTDPNFPPSFIENASVLCQESFSREVVSMTVEGLAYFMRIDSSYSKSLWEPANEDLQHPLVEADSAAAVRTLICVKESESRVGTYTDGSAAFRNHLDVRLVRWDDGQVVAQKSFAGGAPPAYGGLPIIEYRAWLLPLFSNDISKDNLFVDYPPVVYLVFSPDGKFLVMAGGDQSLKVWDVLEQKVVYSQSGFTYGESKPAPVAFSSDSKLLAVRDTSGLSILNTQTWEVVSELTSADLGQNLFSVSFSSDNELMAVGTQLGVRVLQTQDLLEIFNYTTFSGVSHVVITPDDKYLVAGVYSIKSRLTPHKGFFTWDLKSGNLLASQEDTIINDMALLADGRTLALATAEDPRIWLYNLETTSVAGYLSGHISDAEKLSLSSDGKWLISIDQKNEMILWDMQKLQLYKILPAVKYNISALALSTNGSLLAVGSLEDGVVNLLELN